MKFRAERDALLDALGATARAAATRGGGSASLSGIRLDAGGSRLDLAGSDLDVTIQVGITVTVHEPGVCVIPAKLATDIVRALEPGAVTVSAEGGEAVIAAGRSQFGVRLLPAEEFLRLPTPTGNPVALAGGELRSALEQVVRAASRDEARPILTGVLMEAEAGGLRLVATDSYRLAMRDLPGTTLLEEGQSVLVPSRALGELTRLLAGADQVELRLATDEASFSVGNARLTTRLLEGDFPNYRQLIPQHHPNRLTVARDAFLDATRRVKLLARDSAPIRLTFRPEGVELTAITQDVGQAREEVDAKYEGGEMTIAFNPDFLTDGVEAMRADEVVLGTEDALKPATLRAVKPAGSPGAGSSSDYLYLLMPVRVS